MGEGSTIEKAAILACFVMIGATIGSMMRDKPAQELAPAPPADIELDAIRAEVQHLRRIVESIPNLPDTPETIKACQ